MKLPVTVPFPFHNILLQGDFMYPWEVIGRAHWHVGFNINTSQRFRCSTLRYPWMIIYVLFWRCPLRSFQSLRIYSVKTILPTSLTNAFIEKPCAEFWQCSVRPIRIGRSCLVCYHNCLSAFYITCLPQLLLNWRGITMREKVIPHAHLPGLKWLHGIRTIISENISTKGEMIFT